MDSQEIFSKVRKGLLNQMEKSLDDGGDCVYRNDRNLKCAVGHLIPDEFYDPEIEGIGIASIQTLYDFSESKPLLKKILDRLKISSVSYELLRDLQYLHDYRSPDDWELLLAIIADKHGLKNE